MSDRAFQFILGIFGAIISVVIGVVGTKVADRILSAEQLVYTVTPSEPFVSNNEGTQIIRVEVENSGSKLLEEIRIDIDPKGRKIDQFQLSGLSKELVLISRDRRSAKEEIEKVTDRDAPMIRLKIESVEEELKPYFSLPPITA